MNPTGPADYRLPPLNGTVNVPFSNKRNSPKWSLRKRSKGGWFPNLKTDYQGGSSPPATSYSPDTEKKFHNK